MLMYGIPRMQQYGLISFLFTIVRCSDFLEGKVHIIMTDLDVHEHDYVDSKSHRWRIVHQSPHNPGCIPIAKSKLTGSTKTRETALELAKSSLTVGQIVRFIYLKFSFCDSNFWCRKMSSSNGLKIQKVEWKF